ncbi:hypothetical protein KPH14_011121 [Odynerus spinipes]|uniref:Uncharacterized protein n=1 Tax=Odynerus spinipes TaxID=1348599 RepID=A0AAD9RFQ0_9HYME|nr:hypothetical protein KPH14_011121 [Odynerus spinipes]
MRSIILFFEFGILVIVITNVPRVFAIPVADPMADAFPKPEPEPIFTLFGKMASSALLQKIGAHIAAQVAGTAVSRAVDHAIDTYIVEENS